MVKHLHIKLNDDYEQLREAKDKHGGMCEESN